MTRARAFTIAIASFLLAVSAQASWYDDYDAGINAARQGNWSVVAQKMTAAINGNAKENNRTRTYGAIFINYHPYYYRGVANLNLGRYEQAVSDFERTSGAGELDLGSISDLIGRAKSRLEASNTPAPQPQPQPVPQPQPTRPAPVPVPQPTAPILQPSTPAPPSIDPGLRARASSALNAAKAKLASAQRRKATASPQYGQALSALTDANTRNATARSNDDLNTVIAVAENAGLLADSAVAPGVAAAPPPNLTPVPRPSAATDAVLGEYRPQIRTALENYFAGEFETAARNFEELTRKMPGNGWLWAFLGASQYSVYAFEADETFKAAAIESFRKAKRMRSWKGGLPDKYFSKRIRRVFEGVG